MAEKMDEELVNESSSENVTEEPKAEDSASEESKSATHSRKSSSCESTGFVKIDGDEVTPVTEAEMFENFDITAEQTQPEPLDAPMKPDQEQFYTTKDTYRALSNLIMFSSAMFILPLLIMFSMYHYVFIDHFHMLPADAMLYSAFCGIATVIVIVTLFIYVAYKEEEEAEKKVKQSRNQSGPSEDENKKDK